MEGVIIMIEQEELEQITKDLGDRSFVLVVFNDVGSVMKAVAMSNVIPEQLMALGAELEMMGKNGIIQARRQQAEQEHQGKIVVPKANIGTP